MLQPFLDTINVVNFAWLLIVTTSKSEDASLMYILAIKIIVVLRLELF